MIFETVGCGLLMPVSGHPDLGLHASSITYNEQIDGTHWDVTIEYDFSDSGQLDDWTAMSNTTLAVTGGVATCTISGSPSGNIIGMRTNWNIVPSRIDYLARNTTSGTPRTINVYCNVTTFTGGNYVPPSPAHGCVHLWPSLGRLFAVNGAEQSQNNIGGVAQNTWYTNWHTWSTSQMQNNWSYDNNTITYTGTLTINDAHILVGGYQSNTEWDTISIRGIYTVS